MAIRALHIGAHNDECEYNSGGVAALLHKAGCEQIFLNIACMWHKKDIDEATKVLYQKQENDAAECLGAKKLIIGDRDGQIFSPSTAMTEEVESIILDFKPDLVFIHWPKDTHVEHRMVAKLSYEALCIAHVHGARIKEIYAFEGCFKQTCDFFHPDFVVDIEEAMPALKDSLLCFDQNTANGLGWYEEKVLQAGARGRPVKIKYGEGYKIIKYPDGSDDFLLKKLLGNKFLWNGNGRYCAHGDVYW